MWQVIAYTSWLNRRLGAQFHAQYCIALYPSDKQSVSVVQNLLLIYSQSISTAVRCSLVLCLPRSVCLCISDFCYIILLTVNVLSNRECVSVQKVSQLHDMKSKTKPSPDTFIQHGRDVDTLKRQIVSSKCQCHSPICVPLVSTCVCGGG